MLNASFGVQRVVRRVRRTTSRRTELAIPTHATSIAGRLRRRLRGAAGSARLLPTREPMAHRLGAELSSEGAAPRGTGSSVLGRLGHERVCGLAVVAILVGATAISNLPPATASASGGVGGTQGAGNAARLVVGGAFGIDRTGVVYDEPAEEAARPSAAFRPVAIAADPELSAATAEVSGPFREDGTLLKPVAVETTVEDASDMLRTYRVRSGDTLVGIARHFGVSIHTIWWANDLKTKALKVGTKLTIPPVNGLVVTVGATDTLDALASRHKVTADAILRANKLSDSNLVIGQVLVVPGAKGEPIPTPKPPKQAPSVKSGGSKSSPPRSRSTPKGPTRYTGGSMAWPVAGGYVSQGYHYGHYGIDIAADHGTRVKAAAGGRVIFAGWKSNGGGYQVHISHGSGLYTTYNHMSSVSVGTGQYVSKGQQVGRVGATGYATGPHLHFEVWKGRIWDGGRRVNPMGYL